MHAGSEPGSTEIYMMPDVSPAPHVAFVPPAGGVDYMGNEVAPEYIFDQGLNYPAANNFGYYGTGFETPGEWGDHHRFFALDGQDLHYLGVQTLYYTPNYGYAQTPYNPYSPYVPGAVVGVDGPFIGSQQYFSSPYQTPPVSSPAYVPVLVHPPSDFVPSSSADPLLFSTGASIASRSVNAGTKSAPLQASSSAATSSQTVASGNLPSASEPCLPSHRNRTRTKLSEGPQVKLQQNNQPLLQESMMHDSASTTNEGGNSGLMQGRDYLSHGVNIVPGPINVTASSNDDFTNFGSNIHGWASVDAYRPGFYFNGVANNGNGSPNVLVEQNKGPRTNRSKGQWTSAGTDGAELNKASTGIAQGNIMINADQYNRDDFPVDHPDAKFFVIKSYSEDDVHKSIKYNVWSSTPNGNKRLDSAYEDARRISVGKPRKCPVFLFFSVNASGQFCGVAEMIGPVDFKRDMDFWQQDKWSGSFPVKWHIIKDVPNTSFRHIILENNENKPVTNSRDTQEIPYISGLNMLNMFKSSPLRTSILDDFMFYEERQKVMCEEKYRQLGRRFNVSPYVPVFVHANEPAGTAEHLLQAGEKRPVIEESSKVVNGEPGNAGGQPPTANERQRDGMVNHPPNGKQPVIVVDQLPKSDGKQSSVTVDQPSKANGKCLSDTFIQTPKAGRMQPSGAVAQLSKTNEKQLNTTVDQLAEMDGKQLSVAVDQSPKADRRKQGCMVHLQRKADGTRSDVDQLSPPDGSMDTKDAKSSGKFGPSSGQITAKLDSSISSNDTANAKPDEAGDSRGVNPVMKIGFLSIDPKEGDSKSSRVVAAEVTPTAVVKVGSVQIKVKGFGESSSRLLTGESVPPESKGLKLNKQGSASDNHPPKK